MLTLLVFGAPLVSLVTIIATIRTARRGWGFAIPLVVFALFSIDVVVALPVVQAVTATGRKSPAR